jgi:hypothetical protein
VGDGEKVRLCDGVKGREGDFVMVVFPFFKINKKEKPDFFDMKKIGLSIF